VPAEQPAHRLDDLLLGDRGQHRVLADQRRGHAAGLEVAGQAVGEGGPDRHGDRAARGECGRDRAGRCGLDADEPDRAAGPGPAPDRQPGGQPAAAHGGDQGQRRRRGQVGELLVELEPDRCLPGDDVRVVVRGHVPPAVRAGQPQRVRLGLLVARAVLDEFDREPLQGGDLGR